MTKHSFKELEKEWYEKLRASGFDDIEDTNHPERPLKQWIKEVFKKKPTYHSGKIEYFEAAREALNWYKFASEFERELWSMHSEGISIRKISAILRDKGTYMHRSSVFRALNKIKDTMKRVLNEEGHARTTIKASSINSIRIKRR